MITSGCKRMGCILRVVIECNLMAGRSKLKGSSIPELWSQIDKVQLPDFDHPRYQFTWWRAFLQYELDRDVFLGGRSVVHWKGSGGGMSIPGQNLVVSRRIVCGWLLARHYFERVLSDPGQRRGNAQDRITDWAALLTWESIVLNYMFPALH